MQAHIENLVKLQAVELERNRLGASLRALPAEVVQAEAALAAAQKQAALASDALSREETLRTRIERDVAALRQKVARYKKQLDDVKTPAQAEAVEHEIRFGEAEIDRLENEELASMERTETEESALGVARRQVEAQAAMVERVKQGVASRREEYSSELAALAARREELRKQIEPDLLARFDRLAASRGTAIARAEKQQCNGCRMGVRPQMWNQLREGELLACDSCGRMLYWDPDMRPAAEERVGG